MAMEDKIIDDMLASEEMTLLDEGPVFSAGDAMAKGGITEETLMAFNFLKQLMDHDIEIGQYDVERAQELGLNPWEEYLTRMEGKGSGVLSLLDQALRMDTGLQPRPLDPNTGEEMAVPQWQIEAGTALQNIFGQDFDLMLRAAKMYSDAVSVSPNTVDDIRSQGDAIRRDPGNAYDQSWQNTPNPPAGWRSVTKP